MNQRRLKPTQFGLMVFLILSVPIAGQQFQLLDLNAISPMRAIELSPSWNGHTARPSSMMPRCRVIAAAGTSVVCREFPSGALRHFDLKTRRMQAIVRPMSNAGFDVARHALDPTGKWLAILSTNDGSAEHAQCGPSGRSITILNLSEGETKSRFCLGEVRLPPEGKLSLSLSTEAIAVVGGGTAYLYEFGGNLLKQVDGVTHWILLGGGRYIQVSQAGIVTDVEGVRSRLLPVQLPTSALENSILARSDADVLVFYETLPKDPNDSRRISQLSYLKLSTQELTRTETRLYGYPEFRLVEVGADGLEFIASRL